MNNSDFLSDDSDKVFEDFSDLMKTVQTVTKKKTGKGAKKGKMVLTDMSSKFSI